MSEVAKKVKGPQSKARSWILSTLFATGIQAFFVTLCLMIVFGLFLSVAFGIFPRMIPDPPPGFESVEPNQTEGSSAPSGNTIGGFYRSYKFAIWYGVSFLTLLIQKFGSSSSENRRMPFGSGFHRFWKRVRENWFKIVVGNAIGCLIAATVFVALQQFSLIRLLVDMILSAIHPAMYAVAGLFFTTSEINSIQDFMN